MHVDTPTLSQPNTQLYQTQPSVITQRPSRLIIISGNSGTMSLETVQDYPPRAYTTARRQKRPATRLLKDIHQKPLTSFLAPYSNPAILPSTPQSASPIIHHPPPSSHLLSSQHSSQLSTHTPQVFPNNTPPPSPFTIPKYPFKLTNQPPGPGSSKPGSPHSPNYHNNRFSRLEVFKPPPISPFHTNTPNH